MLSCQSNGNIQKKCKKIIFQTNVKHVEQESNIFFLLKILDNSNHSPL